MIHERLDGEWAISLATVGRLISDINKVRCKAVGRHSEVCWEWNGCNGSDYGTVRLFSVRTGRYRTVTTARAMFEYVYGPVPDGLLVCHACDNPRCSNPEHLFLGDHIDNSADALRKGRLRWGVIPDGCIGIKTAAEQIGLPVGNVRHLVYMHKLGTKYRKTRVLSEDEVQWLSSRKGLLGYWSHKRPRGRPSKAEAIAEKVARETRVEVKP